MQDVGVLFESHLLSHVHVSKTASDSSQALDYLSNYATFQFLRMHN